MPPSTDWNKLFGVNHSSLLGGASYRSGVRPHVWMKREETTSVEGFSRCRLRAAVSSASSASEMPFAFARFR